MDNLAVKLEKELFETLKQFEKVVGMGRIDLVLRVDEVTKEVVSALQLKENIRIVVDLPEVDSRDEFRKVKSIAFRWVWTVPSLKKSFAGRIMKDG